MRCSVTLFVLVTLWHQSPSMAQSDPEPNIENNIVCYAAKNKWVCAPADDQAQAQEKARKLALGESLEADEEIDPAAIEGVTNASGPQHTISRQPNAEETLLSQISDFIPRSDALKQQTEEPAAGQAQVTTGENTQQPAATTVVQAQPPAAEPPAQTTPDVVTPVSADDGSQRFANWQQAYPSHWSFQVIGTSNRHKLDEFITRHQLSQWPFSIVKTQVNGADWWVVLVGLYDSRDTAIASRDQLPAVLAGGAWVRQINTIIGESG